MKPNVVRDALLHAQTLGVVRVLPRSGAFVQSLDITPLGDALADSLHISLSAEEHNLFHVIDARTLVEVELAGLAADRRRDEDLLPLHDAITAHGQAADPDAYVDSDHRFHLALARVAGNTVLTAYLQALLGLLRPYTRQTLQPARRTGTLEQHAAVYQAVLDRRPEAARGAMRDHLARSRAHLLELVRTPPPIPPLPSAPPGRQVKKS